jgi:haloacetate dehalogenase
MFAGFEEHRFQSEDVEIYTRIGGSGPALLLLHGYPQTHAVWHAVAPTLTEHFTLIVPDLPGYGNSVGRPLDAEHSAYSKRTMAADLLSLMDELGHSLFHLAGHDRGGRVAYRLALDHPHRVKQLAVIDIVTTLDAWESMNWQRALGTYHWSFLAVPAPVPERLIGGDPDFYLEHLLCRWAGKRDALDTQAVDAYKRAFRKPSVIEATCEDYRAGATCDVEHDRVDLERGKKIQCPVLVMWGRGYLSSKADSPAETWCKWADDVTEVALDCGHFVIEEEPTASAQALLQFFGDR